MLVPWLQWQSFAHCGLFLNWAELQHLLPALVDKPLQCFSVYRQFTRYLPGCFGLSVSPLEVLVAWSAAKPGLPEVDPTCKKEAPGTRFDATLKQSPYLASAGQAAAAGEQGVFLLKHPGGADLYHRCP